MGSTLEIQQAWYYSNYRPKILWGQVLQYNNNRAADGSMFDNILLAVQ